MTYYNLDKPIESAIKWVLESGIQNISSDKKMNGGFNSWFDLDKKKYPFIYSEITGYGITTLLYLYKITKNKIFLNRAILAADWIISNALQKSGAVKTRYYYETLDANHMYSFENQIIYAFDTGMVLNAIISLYKVTKKDVYLNVAIKIAEFLLSMQKSDGSFNSMHDAKSKKNYSTDEKWSRTSGSYHAKISIGLLEVFNITGENKFKKSSEKICKNSMKFQKEDGRFTSLKNTTHLHPHSYSIEGLVYAHRFLEKKKFIKSAELAIKWVLSKQLSNGGLPTSSSEKLDTNERTDILSQILRMSIYLMQQEHLPYDYREDLVRLKNRLLQFQNDSQTEHMGGFFYGYENRIKMNHINSWCTMFALQSLIFCDKYFKKNEIELDLLI